MKKQKILIAFFIFVGLLALYLYAKSGTRTDTVPNANTNKSYLTTVSPAEYQKLLTVQMKADKLLGVEVPPIMPSPLPSPSDISSKFFTSRLAILNMYLIQVFVYIYKSGQFKYPDAEDAKQKISKFLPPGMTVVRMLTYNCPGIFSTKIDFAGMVLEYVVDGERISMIVLRGTQSGCEWGEDAKVALTAPFWLKNHPKAKVHIGFNNIYINSDGKTPSLRDQIWKYIDTSDIVNLSFTGHSLGGGICYLFAADITARDLESGSSLRSKTKIFPVAGPYSGNESFVKLILSVNSTPTYSGVFSIINNADSVPTMGVAYYVRVPTQVFCFLNDGKALNANPHFPIVYRTGLEANAALFDSNSKTMASCGLQCK